MPRETAQQVWDDYIYTSRGYGFNKGHATSYGILADRSAYLLNHHAPQFRTALLDVYPEKSRYIAAARSDGFNFLQPDINKSTGGFSYDRSSGGIRVGLGRIDGLGPVAVGEILAGQPYSDFDDFKARTTRRSVNVTRLERLANIGAFESVGIKGSHDDADEFAILGFCLKKPKALKGIKPKHVSERRSESGWLHTGITHGLDPTPIRQSVSKLFWIPPTTKLQLKSSPWAQVKTWLFTVVEENGVAFDLMVNEDKEHESTLIDFLYRKCKGAVICVDGMIRQPFGIEGPQGFRLFGISGCYSGDAQMWGVPDKYKKAVAELDRQKRRAKYA